MDDPTHLHLAQPVSVRVNAPVLTEKHSDARCPQTHIERIRLIFHACSKVGVVGYHHPVHRMFRSLVQNEKRVINPIVRSTGDAKGFKPVDRAVEVCTLCGTIVYSNVAIFTDAFVLG